MSFSQREMALFDGDFAATNLLIPEYLAQVAPELNNDSITVAELNEVLDRGFMVWLVGHPNREAVARFQQELAICRNHLPRECRILG